MVSEAWQKKLKESMLDYDALLDYLHLEKHDGYAVNHFPVKVTQAFANRIKKGDPNDPLLKQILSTSDELISKPGYTHNPVGDIDQIKVPGLIHKYFGRVLVTITGACAIHCRYCFRQHFPYEENTPGRPGWERIVDYISNDTTINEVIYSGGDPLMCKDSLLSELTEKLASIPHLKRLRIHTRMPIVLPQRVCEPLFQWLNKINSQKIIVVQTNHPNEIDEEVGYALKQLKENGITVLNHTVLLKGVNDSADVLAELSEKLFSYDVMPYYLNVLDKVQGAAHFDLNLDEAKKIHDDLLKILPGFLVPKLVQEVAGEHNKVMVT